MHYGLVFIETPLKLVVVNFEAAVSAVAALRSAPMHRTLGISERFEVLSETKARSQFLQESIFWERLSGDYYDYYFLLPSQTDVYDQLFQGEEGKQCS